MHRVPTLLMVWLLAHAAGACGGGVDLPPAPENAPPAAKTSAPARSTNSQAETVPLVWGAGWTLRIRPTFTGVPLKESVGTVTIQEWENRPVSVRYEFPKALFSGVEPEIAEASTGVLRPKPVAGDITVAPDRANDPVFTPPAFWQGGNAASPGPLLWLPPSTFLELRDKKAAAPKLAPLPNGLRMKGSPAPDPGPAQLSVVGTDFAIVSVNGRAIRLPVLQLRDDRGATYAVLDSEQNPLVLQFRFSSNTVVAGRRLLTASGSGYDVVALERSQ